MDTMNEGVFFKHDLELVKAASTDDIGECPFVSVRYLGEIENKVFHSQVRDSIQFRREEKNSPESYLYYSHGSKIFRMNVNTMTIDVITERPNTLSFFCLSPYTNIIFSCCKKKLNIYRTNDPTKNIVEAPDCYGGYEFNWVCAANEEETKIFTVGQTRNMCLYSLDHEFEKTELIWHYDLGSYGNCVCISKDFKYVGTVTDRKGAYIFKYFPEDDRVQLYAHFGTATTSRWSDSCDFCHFNCDGTKFSVSNESYLRIFDVRKKRVEVIIQLPNDSSLAKFSPTNPDVMVGTTRSSLFLIRLNGYQNYSFFPLFNRNHFEFPKWKMETVIEKLVGVELQNEEEEKKKRELLKEKQKEKEEEEKKNNVEWTDFINIQTSIDDGERDGEEEEEDDDDDDLKKNEQQLEEEEKKIKKDEFVVGSISTNGFCYTPDGSQIYVSLVPVVGRENVVKNTRGRYSYYIRDKLYTETSLLRIDLEPKHFLDEKRVLRNSYQITIHKLAFHDCLIVTEF